MLITPRKPKGELRYVLREQRNKPADEQIVFFFRCLTTQERGELADMLVHNLATGELRLNLGSQNLFACSRALRRITFGAKIASVWMDALKGVRTGVVIGANSVAALNDEPMPLEVLELFETPVIGELGRAIKEESNVTEEQEGNSEPQSGSQAEK